MKKLILLLIFFYNCTLNSNKNSVKENCILPNNVYLNNVYCISLDKKFIEEISNDKAKRILNLIDIAVKEYTQHISTFYKENLGFLRESNKIDQIDVDNLKNFFLDLICCKLFENLKVIDFEYDKLISEFFFFIENYFYDEFIGIKYINRNEFSSTEYNTNKMFEKLDEENQEKLNNLLYNFKLDVFKEKYFPLRLYLYISGELTSFSFDDREALVNSITYPINLLLKVREPENSMKESYNFFELETSKKLYDLIFNKEKKILEEKINNAKIFLKWGVFLRICLNNCSEPFEIPIEHSSSFILDESTKINIKMKDSKLYYEDKVIPLKKLNED